VNETLFDRSARKLSVNLSINSDLYARAQASGIDASLVAEEALARALAVQATETLRAEIRQDMEALTEYVAKHGDPGAAYRAMFGPPDAA
jgi:post-segregation antitoxin (ccd killing protein)